MDESELERCYAGLGLPVGADREALKKALMQKNFALIRSGASEEERARLKAAHDAIIAHLDELERQKLAAARTQARAGIEERKLEQLVEEFEAKTKEPELSRWDPRSFDSTIVNVVAPPLVSLLAIAAWRGPLQGVFVGFYVWIHEFGHAIVAWLCGYRALPLPIGWANIETSKSLFVYGGVLFLLGLLFVSGVRERKPAAIAAAIVIALAQAVMTWRISEERALEWIVFSGVGGEFVLSAAMIALFFFRLPEKFRWGGCRYFFLGWGAMGFYETFQFWRKIRRGLEGIPYGSMLYGEEDANGDMNKLHEDYNWTQHDIVYGYNHLGTACLAIILVTYLIFALRLDRAPKRWIERQSEAAL